MSLLVMMMMMMVSAVTTFGAFDWLKDAFDYEHCGSDWIKPDINGNYNTASIEITTMEQVPIGANSFYKPKFNS